jgi:catechol 2,3-dioxygenase-like lactoylglutathione lyase family enzyme
MLSDYRVHPSLASSDIEKARRWYAERLGLEPIRAFPSSRTSIGGEEQTIDGIMAGADSEGADILNAWFRDGDGNWISIVEQPEHPGEPPAAIGVGAMLAAADLARARAWYADKLGLEPVHYLPGEEMVYRQGATQFSVYQTESAGTAKNTVAVWRVDDLGAEAAALRARGVVFGDYEIGGVKTVDGIYTDPDDGSLAAWFVDSEGNTLGLVKTTESPSAHGEW